MVHADGGDSGRERGHSQSEISESAKRYTTVFNHTVELLRIKLFYDHSTLYPLVRCKRPGSKYEHMGMHGLR